MSLSIGAFSILVLSLLSMSIHGGRARKMNSMDHNHHHHHHQEHVADNLDESNLIFFTLKDLKKGKTLPIYLPRRNPSSSPKFLSKKESESIPFHSTNLSNLLHLFSFPNGSLQAKAVQTTLYECELPPITGETKLCATSLEAMLDYVSSVLGDVDSKAPNFKVLSTTHLITKSNVHLQNFTIRDVPREIAAAKMVACHSMAYPYAVFYCHSQKTKNKVLEVSLEGENGDKVEAVAVCHLDTSQWSRDHVSFRVLSIEPGTSDVCHFFPADNLVWVPTTMTVL